MANEMDKNKRRLFKLHELDNYEVADGDPDVRGWDVVADDGQKIGKVDELIVDIEDQKVRYLDVRTSQDVTVGEGERHLLVPISAADIKNNDEVRLNGISKTVLEKYPVFKGGPITYDYEMTLRETLGGLRSDKPDLVPHKGMEFYSNDLNNPEKMSGTTTTPNASTGTTPNTPTTGVTGTTDPTNTPDTTI
jgi:hypothetical protein